MYVNRETRKKTRIRDVFGVIRRRPITQDDFITRAKWRHNNFYDYSKVKFVDMKTKVDVICPIHGVFSIRPVNHIIGGGTGCSKCGLEKGIAITRSRLMSFEEYVKKANVVHNFKYNYLRFDYESKNKKSGKKSGFNRNIVYTCKEHPEIGEIKQKVYSHLKEGNGCRICSNRDAGLRRRRTTEMYIEEAKKVHGDLYDYSKTVYEGPGKKIKIICKKHGVFEQSPDWHLNNAGKCPICGISKGELSIIKTLDKYKIKYIREFKIKGYNFQYDFYLPNFRLLIEFDGVQHFKPIPFYKKLHATTNNNKLYYSFTRIALRDKIKDDIAIINGYKIIRIPYTMLNHLEVFLMFRINNMFKYKYKNNYFTSKEELRFRYPILTKEGCENFKHTFRITAPASSDICRVLVKLLETPKDLKPDGKYYLLGARAETI